MRTELLRHQFREDLISPGWLPWWSKTVPGVDELIYHVSTHLQQRNGTNKYATVSKNFKDTMKLANNISSNSCHMRTPLQRLQLYDWVPLSLSIAFISNFSFTVHSHTFGTSHSGHPPLTEWRQRYFLLALLPHTVAQPQNGSECARLILLKPGSVMGFAQNCRQISHWGKVTQEKLYLSIMMLPEAPSRTKWDVCAACLHVL